MPISNTSYTLEQLNRLFNQAKKIFFIGIGGISMSSIATMCANLGKKIYGYDKERSPQSAALERIGTVKYYSTPDNVTGMDMVIYTNAIDGENLEYKQSKRKGIPLISRANFLGYLISLHEHRIGVAGMHGKSTTTAMLCHIFTQGGINPTVFCGAQMVNHGSNFRFGGRECCIFEACEYQNSFLSLPATEAAILNIDYDHPDFFDSIDTVKNSFKSYIKNAHRVYLNCDSEHTRCLCHPNTITFGFDRSALFRAELCDDGFLVHKQGKLLCKCTLPLKGKHHISDSLCAFAIAYTHGIPVSTIVSALSTFTGNKRRMEFIKKNDTGADIFEDYAHHPAEITASLSALKESGYKSILCVFQAHTYSRSYYLYDSFTKAFAQSSELIFAPIFPAREENIFELSEEQFALDCGAEYEHNIEKIAHRVKEINADCVVLMGAGDLAARLKGLI